MASKKPAGVSENVYRVYKSLTPKPKELLAPKNPPRMFIREGEVYQWRPKERRTKRKYLFLFDDVLVTARKDSKKSFGTKIVMRIGPGTSLKCALVANSSYYIKGVEFRLWNKSRMFVFFGKDPANALSWVRDIVYVMNGGRLPYKAVIDPATGEERDEGAERKDQELLRRIQQLKDESSHEVPENEEREQEMMRASGKDLLGGQEDDWSGFESGGTVHDLDLLTGGSASSSTPGSSDIAPASAVVTLQPTVVHDAHQAQTVAHHAGPGAAGFSSGAGPYAQTGLQGHGNFNQQGQVDNNLLPYNPFLNVGANPFDPFSTNSPVPQSETSQSDWSTMLERAVLDLCMMGKNTIMDLEQMRAMDSSLVDGATFNLSKKNKACFETLYQSNELLRSETNSERRQAQAQKLAKVARDVLPTLNAFASTAEQNVDKVQDDFARGRQRYLFQGLTKTVQNVEDLLPPDERQKAAPKPEVNHVEAVLEKIITSLETSVSGFQDSPNADEEKSVGGNTKILGNYLAELLRVASDAQKSLGDNARKQGQVYHRDPAWEEGLISAAKAVLHNVNLLTSSANRVEAASPGEKEFECDSLIASLRSMNGAFARLLMSARVKIPADSEHAARLDTAAGRVKTSANNLERASLEEALKFRKQTETPSSQGKSGVGSEAKKIEAMSKVARLERELEQARLQISKLNADDYKK